MKSMLIKTEKTFSERNADVSVFRLNKLLKNYRKAQTNVLTIAVAMSIVNASVSLGQSNQTLAVEPAELNSEVSTIQPLPPLAVIEKYLPQPIDQNTFPPSLDDAKIAYIWPAKGVLTSGYGMRWGRMHRGIDIANKIGTPIVAAADGVVTFEGRQRGYGKIIDVRHIDGSLTRYAHNHRHFVKLGQKVQQGQTIAHMGSTGFSTGPHLHFEIHPTGKRAVNPMTYLPSRG
ncbi:metalloendopeptidase-like membrane protein [Rivularia sp. PCC 7116]|nr:metalloendopeptidase-like membrane protein [Rivularia sp. PCC 7116]